MFAGTFGTGEVIWSIFIFFMFFIWMMLLFQIFGDIFRSSDLSGVGKTLWSIFVIILPFLGIFVYLIARGDNMRDHAVAQAKAQDAAAREYIQAAAGSGSAADEIAKLSKLQADGAITDTEFATAKARLLSDG
ncbi:MAG: SHOCT domain-containing protein [Ilumatobacteraceae bacterium]